MLTGKKYTDLHTEALTRFNDIESAVHAERDQCLQDRRFYTIAGAQWEGNLADQFENRPKFEVNKVHLSVMRIVNEYRNNRITADFVPKAGNIDNKLSDLCDGLFRADEVDSGAEEAYDNAFEEAVGGGIGAVRLRAVYEDDEDPGNERQRIRIEPIYDADSCLFFDLDAKRQDKADAKFAFLLSFMTVEAYKSTWKDDPASWPKDIGNEEFDWGGGTNDQVVIAEYYVIELVSDISLLFKSLTGAERRVLQSELEDDPEMLDELIALGYAQDTSHKKPIKKRRVHKYIMSGGGILEDNGYVAGKHIPIVPMYGRRLIIDGQERCTGHVRLAKDAQRLLNMQLSKLGELSASSGTEKPIFTPEQVAGHEVMWSEDNIKNYPYLLINPVTGIDGNPMPAGPTAYTHAPAIPPAQAALLQIANTALQDLLGNQQEADKIVSHVSGEAIELVTNRMDMQSFIYFSNMAKCVRRVGEVWLSMARELYVEEGREMKILGSTDKSASVKLSEPGKDPKTGALITLNDLSKADFDVTVSVGPSFSSQRKATVHALTTMLQMTQDPETQKVLSAMALMNIEGEGIADVRTYFRKQLVQLGAIEPTPEEAEELAKVQNKLDPNTILANAMAEEAQAKAVKALADAEATNAEVEKTRAETLKILTDLQGQVSELSNIMSQLRQPGVGAANNPPTVPGA